ncbi:hypothetical protein [Ursidibacter sp. B-7004-1]
MANSKKPRKKHSRRKENDRLALKAAQGSFLMTVQGLADKGQIWVLNKERVPNHLWKSKAYRKPFELSFLTPRKWHLTSGVACRNQQGEFYVKYFSQQANNEFIYFDPQIQLWIMQELADIVNDVNKEHILTPFTIVNSNNHTFTEPQILDLMHWLKIDDNSIIQTAHEMKITENLAKEEIKDYPFEKYLDPVTSSILRKNDITDWIGIYDKGEKYLRNIKGIGEKRMKAIYEGILKITLDKDLRSQLKNFQDFTLNTSRKAVSVEFMDKRLYSAQEIYKKYQEGKINEIYQSI